MLEVIDTSEGFEVSDALAVDAGGGVVAADSGSGSLAKKAPRSTKKSVTKKPAAKKSVTKKAVTKKAASKKSVTKKSATKKPATKKSVTKKPVAKKAATKKPITKKAASKKVAAKKTTTKKVSKTVAPKKTTKKVAAQVVDAEVVVDLEANEPELGPSGEKKLVVIPPDEKRAASKRATTRKTTGKTTGKTSTKDSSEDTPEKSSEPRPFSRLVMNYVPGEECRVALLEDGKLQEYEAERFDAISRVGNIYLGRVTNVEAGIQAAFVDFGVEEAGFLHVSDLHPQYFPGKGDTTERVGKKTPRRDRPPIEKALKRGQVMVVQVLKDGVGTKGPALTSYLSIPGRFLVMMPEMDRVGVSRSIEDEEVRREMRDTLDQLDLPDGFGFILRTAGLGRSSDELKRDLSYLQRLWKDLEARKKGAKPKLLYSESDLLVRTVRDQLTTEVDEVVIDSNVALGRVGQFMKIVAPKATTSVRRYTGDAPIFQAFGVEKQIDQMYAREVPLPSGGRLVIDETEALVAIDVNSGRMRSRDAEQNAYKCNMEAVDEICRQLRLRDLGGLVINDLIDMRQMRHRRDVEQRFFDNLRRDKAKSTVLPISEFGICEMTRQRMKASHESKHYAECPTCTGRGLVQRPASVADDALRMIDALLSVEKIASVEIAISSRVSGELLSSRRLGLGRLERKHGKHVEVRVSDTLGVDQVRFYAYEENGNDIEISRLPQPTPGEKLLEDWSPSADDSWAVDLTDEADEADAVAIAIPEDLHEISTPGLEDNPEGEGGKKKRRRRRRRRRGRGGEGAGGESEQVLAESGGSDDSESSTDSTSTEPGSDGATDDAASHATASESGSLGEESGEPGEGKKKRRRRRRGRGGRGRGGEGGQGEENSEGASEESSGDAAASDDVAGATGEASSSESSESGQDGEATPKKKRRRRSRKKSTGATEGEGSGSDDAPPVEKPPAEIKTVAPRSLYRTGRRKLSASEISRIGMED